MPWRGKKDVERHNKKCSRYAACRKLWLDTANNYYKRTGDDGQAVIRANVAAKKWLISHGKYRRNIDEDLRALEREAAGGDPLAEERLRHAQIRAGIRPPEFPQDGIWVNAYVNNQARASLYTQSWEEVNLATDFLEKYFSFEAVAPAPARQTFDVGLQEEVTVLAESFQVLTELSPAFDFDEGRAIPRPYHYEPYVSFRLIEPDEFDKLERPLDEESSSDDVTFHWLNTYLVTENYGGPEEGGWNYEAFYPRACLFIGSITLEHVMAARQEEYLGGLQPFPPHILFAQSFLHELYDEYQRRRSEIRVSFEEDPARGPSARPHYE
jgi:hypothetical protein